ncbi:acetylcholine receptor subunit alpha-like [Argonauta hians]
MSQEKRPFFVLSLQLLLVILAPCEANLQSPESRLKKELVKDYDAEVRPVNNPGDRIQLFVTFYLDYVVNIDEKNEVFILKGSIKFQWLDIMVTWDPAKHQGIDRLVLKSSMLWTPSLTVSNAVDSNIMSSQLLHVGNNGFVTMKVTNVYTTHCRIKVSHFPFDTQECEIVFSTMSDVASGICIKEVPGNGYNMSHFSIHDGWSLLKVDHKLNQERGSSDNCSTKIHFFFTIRRNSLYYTLIVITPLIIMYFCTTLVFFIPVDTGEKISFSNVLILSFAVFMNSFSSILPHNAGQVSILAMFVILYLVQCILTFILSCLITRVRYCPKNPFTFPYGIGYFLYRVYLCCVETNQGTLASFVGTTRCLFLPLLKTIWIPDTPPFQPGTNDAFTRTRSNFVIGVEARRQLCDTLDFYLFYFSCLVVFLEILITFCFFTVMSETF